MRNEDRRANGVTMRKTEYAEEGKIYKNILE